VGEFLIAGDSVYTLTNLKSYLHKKKEVEQKPAVASAPTRSCSPH
jgi:hypothetical protein